MDEIMTRERLGLYRNNMQEIKDLEDKLMHLGDGDSLVGNNVILDYTTGYPRPQAVVGYDYEREAKLKDKYMRLIKNLKAENKAIEDFVFNIPNGIERRIFCLYFIDGMRMEKVARKVNLDKSNVSRKIDNYLKNATHATNATL